MTRAPMTIRGSLFLAMLCLQVFANTLVAQDIEAERQVAEEADAPVFELDPKVQEAIMPLFASVANAKVSRTTIQLSMDSLVNGVVTDTKKATYQIASKRPDQYTIYFKETDQRTRIYSDSKKLSIALAPDAYVQKNGAPNNREAVTGLPINLGPYPEVVLALSLAGADPVATFLGAMKSVEIVDQSKFRGKKPAIHFRGIQGDDVTWDLWVTQEKPQRPLRIMVDLTPMLLATQQLKTPEGFKYLLRFDFLSWRISGTVDDELFVYRPDKNAKKYESVDNYYDLMEAELNQYPLLGKKAPALLAELSNGAKIDTAKLKDKILVLDFWATWCEPCAEAMPVIQDVVDEYKDKGAVLLPINVGEDKEKIEAFMKQQGWAMPTVLDPNTRISSGFAATAIPLLVVVSKTGVVESAHLGFVGADELEQRLRDELEVLSAGGRIATAE